MNSARNYFKISLISILIAGCSSSHVNRDFQSQSAKPDLSIGKFCEYRQLSDLTQGGRMYLQAHAAVHEIGECKRTFVREAGTVLIFMPLREDDLSEDIDAFLHPDSYYSESELAEIDCLPDSQCDLGKKEQARLVGLLARGVVVQFDSNSSEPKDLILLGQIASAAKGRRISIAVVGHTDSVGTNKANQKLSASRAERVRKILAEKGLDANLIQAESKGESSPIADNKTSDGRAINRRANLKGVLDGNDH